MPNCLPAKLPAPIAAAAAEVLSVDALRAERCVSCGADRTCRVWKIPEESQLIFRGHCLTIECCRYIAGGAWATGAADGSLSLWSGTKKKPMFTMRRVGGAAGRGGRLLGTRAARARAAAAAAGACACLLQAWPCLLRLPATLLPASSAAAAQQAMNHA